MTWSILEKLSARGIVSGRPDPAMRNLRVSLVVDDMDGERKRSLKDLLRKLGRKRVSDEALGRYDQALTHRSYLCEQERIPTEKDNERLEFLGDRVLNLVTAEFLYQSFPAPEGELTARMEWTKNRNLASLVLSSGTGLEELIRIGRGQEKTPRIIAGAFEAFIAAYYLDAGLERTKKLISRFFPENLLDFGITPNYKKMLQELVQKRSQSIPVYELESRRGAAHQPLYTYAVRVGGAIVGRGSGRTKREATQDAARDALKQIGTCPEPSQGYP
jgi:ribonuclease-3